MTSRRGEIASWISRKAPRPNQQVRAIFERRIATSASLPWYTRNPKGVSSALNKAGSKRRECGQQVVNANGSGTAQRALRRSPDERSEMRGRWLPGSDAWQRGQSERAVPGFPDFASLIGAAGDGGRNLFSAAKGTKTLAEF
jgi:hypothetical protein